MIPTPFDTYNCGQLLKDDAPKAAEVIARFGGTAKAGPVKRSAQSVIGYFPQGLTHEKRVHITSALGNEGIFGL